MACTTLLFLTVLTVLTVFTDLSRAGPLVGVAWILSGAGAGMAGIVAWSPAIGVITVGASVLGGGIAGAVVGGEALASKASAAASRESASRQSVIAASLASLASISHESIVSDISQTVAAAISSMDAEMSAMTDYDTANDPFTFGSVTGIQSWSMNATDTTITPPKLTSAKEPVLPSLSMQHVRNRHIDTSASILNPMSELRLSGRSVRRETALLTNATGWPIAPPGVPQYNFDDCVNDLIAKFSIGENVTFLTSSEAHTIQIDHIPPRCMTLANVMIPISSSGPYPYPLGIASLRWDNVSDDQISTLEAFFTAQ